MRKPVERNSYINIANLHLGSHHKGDDAIALLEIDGPVEQKHLDQFCALPGVSYVMYLHSPSLDRG